jgi:carbamate kinase
MLARQLEAELLLISTGVSRVAIDYGKPTQRWLDGSRAPKPRPGWLRASSPRPAWRLSSAIIGYLDRPTAAA